MRLMRQRCDFFHDASSWFGAGRNLTSRSGRIGWLAASKMTAMSKKRGRARASRRQRVTRRTFWAPMAVIAGGLALAALAAQLMPTRSRTSSGHPEWLPLCPVGAFPVNFAQRIDSEDGSIYFCCLRCIEKYRASPDQYAEAIEKQHAELARIPKVQVACPVSGVEPDPNIALETKWGKLLFCSVACAERFQRNGNVPLNLTATFTYQQTCPVTGRPFDPRFSAPVNKNVRLYFCSAECVRRFRESPGKYQDALAQQGFRGRF